MARNIICFCNHGFCTVSIYNSYTFSACIFLFYVIFFLTEFVLNLFDWLHPHRRLSTRLMFICLFNTKVTKTKTHKTLQQTHLEFTFRMDKAEQAPHLLLVSQSVTPTGQVPVSAVTRGSLHLCFIYLNTNMRKLWANQEVTGWHETGGRFLWAISLLFDWLFIYRVKFSCNLVFFL